MCDDKNFIANIEIDADRKGQTVSLLAAYMRKLEEYTRASNPDKVRLADLVVKAKGPKRSMRKYAEEIYLRRHVQTLLSQN